MSRTQGATPLWTVLAPLAALAFIALEMLVLSEALASLLMIPAAALLFASVFAAVHHAETIAHRVGQPFGSIILALAVTVIEVSLIVSLLLSAPEGESTVARDTVFSAIMIVLNGIVGLCLLIGGVKYHRQTVQVHSATAALGVLGTLAVLALVLPNYTKAVPGPLYAPAQLVFVAVVSLALYGFFLHAQTVRHRDDFHDKADDSASHDPVSRRAFLAGIALLPVALLSVVLLAETLAVPVEHAIDAAGLPVALVGVAIALVVLMPEGVASIRAARANRLQTSINLALGSALASLCLTIPTVALISLALGQDLVLGLEAEHIVLLLLSLFMATVSLATGRTTSLQGGIHLVIFGAFLTLSAVP
ncbi:calcium:proton antiporter [Yoonia sp.]|uniref:calcium:proton antiporter n=1 Tax=Yoonia sp. TaxID=2212373 RepID=UPI0019F48081|nr:calcium:proton antiporter [Yoonia sp.]MBE0414667.1 ionic transporter y4hA [Yoonia sp.]